MIIIQLPTTLCVRRELPALFMTVRREIAELRRETGARRPGDWLRRLRRCLSRCSSDWYRRQKEGRQSPTVR